MKKLLMLTALVATMSAIDANAQQKAKTKKKETTEQTCAKKSKKCSEKDMKDCSKEKKAKCCAKKAG